MSTAAVTVTTLSESSTKMVIHVLIESDGSLGEQTNYVIYDPTVQFPTIGYDPLQSNAGVSSTVALNQYGPINVSGDTNVVAKKTSIVQVWHSCSWFDVLIRFNALVPITGWTVSRDSEGYNDFRYFGGIKDRSGVEGDGKIMISTLGIDSVPNLTGTLILEIRKD